MLMGLKNYTRKGDIDLPTFQPIPPSNIPSKFVFTGRISSDGTDAFNEVIDDAKDKEIIILGRWSNNF